jgi:hypothetical protein
MTNMNPARKKDTGQAGNGGEFGAQKRTEDNVTLPAEKAPRISGSGIGGYTVKGFKKYPIGREGGAFSASIYRDGKKVMTVENLGNGGPNDYTETSTGSRHSGPEINAFKAKSNAAYGGDFGFGSEDIFIEAIMTVTDYEKHATKHNFDRDEIVAENLAYQKKNESFRGPWQDREDAFILDPSIVD